MSATYKTTLLTARDRIRFRLGDVDVNRALLSDQEIAAVLTLKGGEDAALIYLAKGLLSQFAHQPTRVSADGTVFDFSERIGVWRELVAELGVSTGYRIRRMARPQLINGGAES